MQLIKKRFKNIYSDFFSIFRELFIPKAMFDSIENIKLDQLYYKGYRTLILDVDNTLLTYYQRHVTLQKMNWVEYQKSLGFRVFLVSNNLRKKRMNLICNQLNVTGIYFSLKPFVFSVRSLMEEYFIDPKKTIVIGDQVFTDILMGNWLKTHTILVDPVDKKLSFTKTLQREIELYLMNFLLK